MSSVAAESVEPLLEPRQARRVRWCGVLATAVCAAHILSAIVLLGWYYYVVPRWKHELEDFGYDITQQSKYVIHVSDSVVFYWYFLVPIAPVTVIIDFMTTRWIAWHIGLRYASLVGLFVIILMLANVAVGQYVLIDAKAQVLKLISIQGPSPWARPAAE